LGNSYGWENTVFRNSQREATKKKGKAVGRSTEYKKESCGEWFVGPSLVESQREKKDKRQLKANREPNGTGRN